MKWLSDENDGSGDLCAHGIIYFEIDGNILVSEKDEIWTVSASALYLLRTLESDHSNTEFEAPYGGQIFPCCGFNMYDIEGEENVVIDGCPNGIDFEITHEEGRVKISFEDKKSFLVPLKEWQRAIIEFSKRVKAFYAASSPKIPWDDENKAGYEKFIAEWNRRHDAAILALEGNK